VGKANEWGSYKKEMKIIEKEIFKVHVIKSNSNGKGDELVKLICLSSP
jgi:hypothetical protein